MVHLSGRRNVGDRGPVYTTPVARRKGPQSMIPETPAEMSGRIHDVGHLLRVRKVARLEEKGFDPPTIAAHLSKEHSDWTLELVLQIQGVDPFGTKDERKKRRVQYCTVQEEVKHPELLDFDRELQEARAACLVRLNQMRESIDDDIALKAMKEVFRLSGSEPAKKEIHYIEHRMPDDLVKALESISVWKPPKSVLQPLIDEGIVDAEVVGDAGSD